MNWTSVDADLPPKEKKVEVVIESESIDSNHISRIIATGVFFPRSGWHVLNYRVEGCTSLGVIYWRIFDPDTERLLNKS